MRKLAAAVIFILIISIPVSAQADLKRWGKSTVNYSTENSAANRQEDSEKETPGSFILNTSRSLYSFFISDLDGDNCPFQPTCSSFFIQSVKSTNLFQGILMFSDRFTRDMNLVKIDHYPLSKNMRLYDPVSNYMLLPEKIRYIPSSEYANE
ncbi:MAG: membrane protein insertion efficiency factor YidD [Bacillota bacterium]